MLKSLSSKPQYRDRDREMIIEERLALMKDAEILERRIERDKQQLIMTMKRLEEING